ncbi:MAG TPA: isoprenylcysteine carboxylmethyltransferase family protein [Terriglobia bacterium]|nr:isoprenylcysteine carboxylmethyltransferase family protein [Candidatus Acidoferrum sp.]HMD84284.1 isoprenylcysteine carboxylmethyltransferase family protein [Terriglobia bacterium]
MNWLAMDAGRVSAWAEYMWMALWGVWVVMWFSTKSVKKRETSLERVQHLIPLILGFWLLFEKNWNGLSLRLVPDTPAAWWLGLVLTAAGVTISIWARVSLGTNWSGVVTLKDNHELIRKGLYRWIRHPIYTGILLAMIGTAMIKGHLRGWLGFLIVWAAFYIKARREEGFLRGEFGERFEEHAKHTGMFFPKWT